MQTKHSTYWKALRVVLLAVVAPILITLLVVSGRIALAMQSDKSATELQENSPSVLAEPTPVPSPEASRGPASQSAAGPAQCNGVNCTITSLAGWQQVPLTVKRGDPFSITYLNGTWTVDKRNWPLVGPEGYSAGIDSQIGYVGLCKVNSGLPYGAMLGKIDDGPSFLIGRGGTFTADRDGALSLQINDNTICQGDNEGSVVMQVPAPSCARLSIAPSSQTISADGTGATQVQVADVSNLYGVQFHLTFDPNIVQVVDADSSKPGTQIAIGPLFSGKDYFVAQNQVDNTTGVIVFAITLRAPATSIVGSGTLAAVTWQGKGPGQSALTLTQTGLADPNGGAICHRVENGNVQVGASSTLSGRVLLQGATNHAGTNVFMTVSPRISAAKITAQEISGVPFAVTDATGHFGITPDTEHNYKWLWVYRPCYLTGKKELPQGNLGTLTLPAGDLNEDDRVNIYDLTKAVSCFGNSKCSCADFNQDGSVNIFDLVIIAGNLGKYGSVSNWQP